MALGSAADRFGALLAGQVDATMVLNTEAAKLQRYPEIVSPVGVGKALPDVPYEFTIAGEEYLEKNPGTLFGLARALLEANRWIAANRAGTAAVAAKVMREETAEVAGRAYDLADPRLWGVNGGISEAASRYTVEFLLEIGYLKTLMPYEELSDRRFPDRALKERGRLGP